MGRDVQRQRCQLGNWLAGHRQPHVGGRVIRSHGSDPGEEWGEGDEGHILARTCHPHPEPAWLFQQQQCSHRGCSQQSRYPSKRVRAWVLHSPVPGTRDEFC